MEYHIYIENHQQKYTHLNSKIMGQRDTYATFVQLILMTTKKCNIPYMKLGFQHTATGAEFASCMITTQFSSLCMPKDLLQKSFEMMHLQFVRLCNAFKLCWSLQ